MDDRIRIDALPTTVAPNPNHVVPAMYDGIAVRLSLAQIIALGRTATELADGFDFDSITANGFFILTSDVNAPAAGSRWLVSCSVDPTAPGRIFQEAMQIAGGDAARVYTRRSVAGVFGPWSGGSTAAEIAYDDSTAYSGAENVQEALEESANYIKYVENETTLQSFVHGLTLSNNGTDANNDIDIAPGQARGNGVTVTNSATLTKRLDAAWTVGNGNGGLDTGSKAASATYHVHAIRRNSDGVFDALFSTSATSPVMPSGWTRVQRLGAIMTDGSGNIRPFVQDGNEFRFNVTDPTPDYAGAGNRAQAPLTCTLPNGIRVQGIFRVSISGANGDYRVRARLFDGANANIAADSEVYASTGVKSTTAELMQYTNTSRQIQLLIDKNAHPSTNSFLMTVGWIDYQIPRIGA